MDEVGTSVVYFFCFSLCSCSINLCISSFDLDELVWASLTLFWGGACFADSKQSKGLRIKHMNTEMERSARSTKIFDKFMINLIDIFIPSGLTDSGSFACWSAWDLVQNIWYLVVRIKALLFDIVHLPAFIPYLILFMASIYLYFFFVSTEEIFEGK